MAGRTKRIFISDIHLGDKRSMNGERPYCWIKKNIKPLARFLDEQRTAPDVKEVIILGDLFDDWVVPTDIKPLASFEDIFSTDENKAVIDSLKALAAPNCPVKLAYVPGNHDMNMTFDIAGVKAFMEENFPGIRVIWDGDGNMGAYSVANIAAEHGHRYGLFNAPDTWTHPNSCLPIGYFITRVIAYKAAIHKTRIDLRSIFINFIKNFMNHPDIVGPMFNAVAAYAGLKPNSVIDLNEIPGFTKPKTVQQIGEEYSNLIRNWSNTPGRIYYLTAIAGDIENLSPAANDVYFNHTENSKRIVIFGHTHVPFMDPHALDPKEDFTNHDPDEPWLNIYANCGTWVDRSEKGCTYVETEEVPDKGRHYVRVMTYPAKTTMYEGFVKM
jgi:UDP-2,3-diacylglucosamine pyrophosphatase LpxH